MVVTGFLVWLQQRVVSGRSYITVAGKAFRPGVMKLGRWRYFTLGLAVVYLVVVVVLPTLALIVAAFRKFLFIRNVESLFDMQAVLAHPFRAAVRQSAGACARSVNTMEVGLHHRAVRRRAGVRDRLHGPPHAGCRAARAST